MKTKIAVFTLCQFLLLALADASSIHTLQVTIGASTTQIVATGSSYAREVSFQNNATHTMRIGDSKTSATRGALLSSGSPGGSITLGPVVSGVIDLSTFWVNGTQNDVLDVVYVD